MRLHQRVKALPVQQLVTEPAVEALVVAIFPGTAAFDEQRLDADPGEQFPRRVRRKLRTVAWTDRVRRPAIGEQIG